MTKVRRSGYAFIYVEDDYQLDARILLRGELPEAGGSGRLLALAILTGRHYELSREQFDVLLSVPASRWVEADGRHSDVLRDLAEIGLLISDAHEERLASLRLREESLSAGEWNVYAALYHFMTQWSSVDIREPGEDSAALAERTRHVARDFVAQHGAPPRAVARLRGTHVLPLPGPQPDGELYRALKGRRTTRAFDTDVPMTAGQLGTVLRYVFGCHGYATTSGDVVCIKRTSPSGGGLHPIEAYPIVSNVDGVPAGIYHYGVGDHALGLISELEPDEAQRLASSFMCGQTYFGAAHVAIVLTARFYRNHWKYRRHPKAYAGILMDAAHLSQALYLVSGELGLGASITIAINSRDIEERLGLDGVAEGVIAMLGCGRRSAEGSPLELRYSSEPLV